MRTPLSFMENILGKPGGVATLDNEGKLVQREGLQSSRYASVSVGTALAGYTKDQVDFLCTGQNDHTVINTAISSLGAAGGEIYLLEGTYQIGAAIAMNKANVTLRGTGNGTVLSRNFSGGSVIAITQSDIAVTSLAIEGNKASYTGSGIIANNQSRLLFTRLYITNCRASAIDAYSSTYVHATHNICLNNTGSGIKVGSRAIVANNSCYENTEGIVAQGSDGSIADNLCRANTNVGIVTYGATFYSVTGNISRNNGDTGIGFWGKTNDSMASGNICYAQKRGIWVSDESGYDYIVGNMLRHNTYDIVHNSSTNTIGSNKLT